MIWIKRITLVLLALFVILVIAIAALLYTPAGVKVALWGAQKALPALSVGKSSGSLLSGFSLAQVSYDDGSTALSVQSLNLVIDDKCLLEPAICISALTVDGVTLSLPTLPDSSVETESAPSEPTTEIALPLPIRLEQLALNNIDLDILGNKIAWQRFTTAAEMNSGNLTLKPTDWQGITLMLAASEEEPVAETESTEASDSSDIVLPTIVLPLSIDVQRFTVTGFELKGDAPQTVEKLELVATATGSDIALTKLELDIPQAKLDANGIISLTKNYPLSLDAGLDIAMPPLSGHQLALNVTGSLDELILDASLKGTLDAVLAGQISPLKSTLPFDLNLRSQHIQWPLDQEAEFVLAETQIDAKGDLDKFIFSAKSDIDGKPMPAVGADLVGSGSTTQVDLSRLELKTLGGKVTGKAKANWKELVNWQGELAFTQIQPELEWPDVQGNVNGKLKTSGGLTASGGWYVELPMLDVDGTVMKQPLDLDGQLTAKDLAGKGDIELNTQGLSVRHGPNSLKAEGRLAKTWDMTAKINAPDLSQSVPGLRGSVAGDVALSGKMAEPNLQVDLVGQTLGWQDVASLESLIVKGKVQPVPTLNADISLFASKGKAGSVELNQLSLLFNGTESQHQLELDMDATPVSTSLRLAGALDRQQGWQGKLEHGEIATEIGPWRLSRPTALGYNLKTQLANVAAHCWQQNNASLCLTENLEAGASGHAKVAINHFDFDLVAPYLPENVELNGEIGANAEATWAPESAPYVKANVRLPSGSVTQQLEADEPAISMGWDSVTLNAEMKQDTLNADWLIAVKDNGDLSGRATVTQLTSDQQLEANLKIDSFMLGFLQPLLRDYHQFDGQVDANLSMSGPVMHPKVNGVLKVMNVEAIGRTVPVDIEKADITATFSGYSAQLHGDVVTPDGKLALKGSADWQDLANWESQLRVNGRELQVSVPPMIALKVSPDLTIKASPKLAEITGSIGIPWGRITVDQLPESAVSVSSDEVLLTDDLQPIDKDPVVPFAVKTNVLVKVGDDVQLSAFGLKSGLIGELNVRQNNKGPLVYGEINLTDGTYRSFAQELVIRKGQILFNGPADQPYLSIEAIRDPENIEDDVIAGIRVTGPADEPRIDIFSDPSMPQQNALSYILRGKDLDSESGDSGDAMTTALISMGLAQSGQLVGNVGEAFGVQDLALDTAGSGSESQVTISGYIAPGLQVKYGVGIFDSIGEFTVRYRLMKDLYVEVVSGLDSAVDLLYQFEFN
ncbi:translocation/assembly module TamB [Photobacterium makurazakiensis]|uniref:autotransporter assembly complex protein TamB n=1 Tax=Photobacterium makurazakiensis TaxID=2910234 RepID=UPI003D0C1A5C